MAGATASSSTAAAATSPDQDHEPVRFRSKKRKLGHLRQRTEFNDDHDNGGDDDARREDTHADPHGAAASSAPKTDSTSPPPDADEEAPPIPASDNDDEEESAVAAAMRLRNARRGRPRTGVGFASSSSHHPAGDMSGFGSRAVVPRSAAGDTIDEESSNRPALRGIGDRFTHQTGLVASLNDKHMTEYIESRLSSRNAPSQGAGSTSASTQAPAPDGEQHDGRLPSRLDASSSSAHKMVSEQPAKHGKLLEVQVPDRAWDRRDEAKRQRADKAATAAGPSSKSRRGRNRRGSDDIKRDQLVEQFLHENRLDVYDVPAPSAARPTAPGNDTSADDRMAEQFRQQYLDEMAQRRQRKRPAQSTTRQQQPQGDVLKGPKLGGSRNQRAAVRDALLKQEKEKAGKRF